MYSIVLMCALSSGAETPACHMGHGCDGCSGAKVACSGCHGGLFSGHGCHGGLFKGHGCHESAWSYAAPACSHSACSSSHGGLFHKRGCHCYAPVCTGHVPPPPACHGGCSAPMAPKSMPEPIKEAPKQKTEISAPATIVVSLPAEARLLIDGTVTQSTSETRVFASPALEAGKDYSYTLKGELVRDGRTITTSKEVIVRSGAETRVQLEFPSSSVAQK